MKMVIFIEAYNNHKLVDIVIIHLMILKVQGAFYTCKNFILCLGNQRILGVTVL